MTSKNTWVPTKLDDVEGASDLMISQFPPIPIDAIDSFYNDQGGRKVIRKLTPLLLIRKLALLLLRIMYGTIQNLLELKVKSTDQNLKRIKRTNVNG